MKRNVAEIELREENGKAHFLKVYLHDDKHLSYNLSNEEDIHVPLSKLEIGKRYDMKFFTHLKELKAYKTTWISFKTMIESGSMKYIRGAYSRTITLNT